MFTSVTEEYGSLAKSFVATIAFGMGIDSLWGCEGAPDDVDRKQAGLDEMDWLYLQCC